jgi:eukaryotic-like serine/threonine-protein kinase
MTAPPDPPDPSPSRAGLTSSPTELTPAGTAPPESDFLKPGTRLAHFEITDRLGSGGFGVVYGARDTRLGRTVALKVLPESFARNAERRERFRLEAIAASALNHPNICTIHDFLEDPAAGCHFIVMEHVEGRTLHDLLESGPLPAEKAIDLGIQLASALAEAHAAGILHRDIKSTNIVVTPKGQAKILDFGIAKRVGHPHGGSDTTEDALGLTAAGAAIGTLTYMSPEQLLGKPIDARSDLFSLGVVLYEIVAGRLPFAGSTPAAVTDALLHSPPRELPTDRAIPEGFKSLIRRLLEKDREKRPPNADAVREELARLAPGRSDAASSRLRRPSSLAALAVLVLLLLVAAGGFWLYRRSARLRWVQQTLPEIDKLVTAEKFPEAAALLRRAREIEPKDATLEKLWTVSTIGVSVESDPPGADVSYRPMRGDANNWTSVGVTPVTDLRIAKDYYLWRIQKPGFAPAYEIEPTWTLVHRIPYKLRAHLVPAAEMPAGMTRVSGGKFQPFIPGVTLAEEPLDDFLIDRHEVTNEEFQKFVDAGGYAKREFWKEPFTRDGKPASVPFEEAIGSFIDATGRPGPATWEAGHYKKGLEKHPVAGVSWYEAAAYAAFAGKSLPTVYHWNRAAQTEASMTVSTMANFQGEDTLPVVESVDPAKRVSGFGTTDMAGNVKEWCSNGMASGKRYILGGGFGEPTYMFIDPDSQSPWTRRPNFGFRCVRYLSPPAAATTAAIETEFRDFSKEKPASDELFRAYAGSYAYDKTPLNARVEETQTFDDWKRERISLDAAYGGGTERLLLYVFTPLHGKPPYQSVVYFPGSGALLQDEFTLSSYADFVPRSGRALIAPIYKSTFQRRDTFRDDNPTATTFYRDHMVMWQKDLARSLDYADTRPDLRHDGYGYLGLSWGSQVAPVMVALEPRVKAVILESGGLSFPKILPEADPFHFLPRVKVPTLMINGRYDHFFPVETSQKPFFDSLGTPPADKKYVLYETGHAVPRKELIRESLDWLDKYLGAVGR